MVIHQSKQSYSPNGKITPAVLFLLMPNRHFLVKFWKCQRAVSILFHEAKTLLELFCLQLIVFGQRQNSSSRKEKWMILHWWIRTGSDWWFSKNLRIRTGSDSILSDQDWTRTENIHSPLIFALHHLAIAAPAKSSSPMSRCQEMLWCAVGALLRNQRYAKED